MAIPDKLNAELNRQKAIIVSGIETRNLELFSDETEKLDAWADDQKVSLEREIKELDRRIKETRTKSKGAATLAEKLAAQKEQRELETQRDRKRRELFARQDENAVKHRKIIVKGAEVRIATREEQDYISLTDMVRNFEGGSALIEQWLKKKDTVLFLGIWEQLNNEAFNSLEFEGIKHEAGRNSFFLSAKKWIDKTGAIGLYAKAGRYGATLAYKAIFLSLVKEGICRKPN